MGVTLLLFAVLMQLVQASEWPMFGLNPSRNSYSTLAGNLYYEEGKCSISDSSIWQSDLGAEIQSSPAIQDGTIFIGVGNFGMGNSALVSVDGSGGSVNWAYSVGGPVFSSPAVHDLKSDGVMEIIFGSGDGKFYCVNETGELVWDFQASGNSSVDSSPMVASDGGSTLILFGSLFGSPNFYALDENGNLQWNFTTGSFGVFSSPALFNATGTPHVVFGSYDGFVYSLYMNGSTFWNYYVGEYVEGTPSIIEGGDGKIIIGSDSGVHAFDFHGNPLWEYSCGSVRGGIASGDVDGNGEKEIIFGSYDNNTYVLDENGNLKWNFNTGDKVFASPSIADLDGDGNKEIVVSSMDGMMYSFDASGEIKGSVNLTGSLVASPAFADVDNDGTPEIIGANKNGVLFTLERMCIQADIQLTPFDISQTFYDNKKELLKFNLTADIPGLEFDVCYFDGVTQKKETVQMNGTSEEFSFYWTNDEAGNSVLSVEADCSHDIEETNEDNNAFNEDIVILAAPYAEVSVVIDLNGTLFTRCVRVPEFTDGYQVLGVVDLVKNWSLSDSFGHSLCSIENMGCSSSDCWCNYPDYWAFQISKAGESAWTYSPVGFDEGDSTPLCWNRDYSSYEGHYCTSDGDSLGLIYGPYGTQLQFVGFNEVCEKADGSGCTYGEECAGNNCVRGYCSSSGTYCGDDVCEGSESHQSCPSDCHEIGSYNSPSACYETWNCTEWSECTPEGIQIRMCTEEHDCGTGMEKPEMRRYCEYVTDKTTKSSPDAPEATDDESDEKLENRSLATNESAKSNPHNAENPWNSLAGMVTLGNPTFIGLLFVIPVAVIFIAVYIHRK